MKQWANVTLVLKLGLQTVCLELFSNVVSVFYMLNWLCAESKSSLVPVIEIKHLCSNMPLSFFPLEKHTYCQLTGMISMRRINPASSQMFLNESGGKIMRVLQFSNEGADVVNCSLSNNADQPVHQLHQVTSVLNKWESNGSTMYPNENGNH